MVTSIIRALRPLSTQRTYRKNAPIFFQGEVPRAVVVILNGIVWSYNITSTGEERTIALYSKGDIIPLAWALGSTPTSLLHYEAFCDTRVLELPKDTLREVLIHDDSLQQQFLQHTTDNYASLLLRITGLSQSRAIEKIAYTLYYLTLRCSIEKEPGMYELNLRLSQAMIASLIGQTRESTTRNLKQLKQSGVVTYTSGVYVVDRPRLEKFIGEDSFRDLLAA